jgi:hypothetical protein
VVRATVLVIALAATAEAGTVRGRIVGADGAPIAGAYVHVGGAPVATGGDGRFALADLPAGTYTIVYAVGGHADAEAALVVGDGDVALADHVVADEYVCILPGEPSRPGPVRTWLANDEMLGVVATPERRWFAWGAGLAVRRRLGRHVELGLEGHALRLDTTDDDPSHGFELRAGAALGVGLEVSRWADIEWRVTPELGAASSVLVGDGTNRELFAGVRATAAHIERSARDHRARGIGGHVGMRISRTEAGLGGWVTLGYDWGL